MSGGKKAQFFPSLMKQKVDTLRWCIKFGGCDPCVTHDDQGRAALENAAALGLLKSLRTIVETMERSRDRRMDFQFGPAGMTAVMLAAANGHLECVKLLVNYSASLEKKCKKGKTARDYAEQQRKHKVVAFIDEELGEDEEEELEEVPDDGLSTAQRAKQKKKEKERIERGLTQEQFEAEEAAAAGAKASQKTEKWDEEESKLAALSAAAKAGEGDSGIFWPELKAILVGSGGKLQPLRELNILRGTASADPAQAERDMQGFIDPFLWNCYFLNRLQLKLPAGKLMELSPEIGQLRDMQTLILSENSLQFLPESIGDLKHLKILEVDKNKLEDLPASLATLKQLEVLNVSNNCLTDIADVVGEVRSLVSLNASGNKLESLELPYADMKRLANLSASENPITELDPRIGQIDAGVCINFSDCQLTTVPGQIGEIKAKKLQILSFMGNPLKDNRLKKIMKGVEEGNKPMKELLNYIKKQPKAKQQAKSAKPKKKSAPAPAAPATPPEPPKAAAADDDDSSDGDIDLDDI